MKLTTLLALTLSLYQTAFAYNIKTDQVTVSGISSGAYMAGQLHMAHSETFSGVALIAGGPYLCSQGILNRALESCMRWDHRTPTVAELVEGVTTMESLDMIDSSFNIVDDKVFLLAGLADKTVDPELSKLNESFYLELGVPFENIQRIELSEAGHTFPTIDQGLRCSIEEPPFIGRCDFDGAYHILSHLHGDLDISETVRGNNLFNIDQNQFFDGTGGIESISMDNFGKVYIPQSCQNDAECGLHVALHGCRQSHSAIDDIFYTRTGFNPWAEANDIIILYPQALPRFIAPMNPKGCWDFWGYNGGVLDYSFASKNGQQIKVIHKMVQSFLK